MYKRICDNCKKVVGDGYASVSFAKMKKLIYESFDICEKCLNSIPKILKDIQTKKSA